MDLKDYIDPLSFDIAFWLGAVKDPNSPVDELGALSLEVSTKLRTAAIIVLVTQGNSDAFYHNLIRSGRAREMFLQRMHREKRFADHHFVSGHYEPLLDSIAAGDLELARLIAALSPDDFRPDHEYEDDYCYAQVLHRLLQPAVDEPAISAFLARFEAYLSGEASPRFDVCRALAGRDQALFDSAFNDLLLLRDEEVKEEKFEPDAAALQLIFVEGLALLRLAEMRIENRAGLSALSVSGTRVPIVMKFPGE